MLGPLLAVGLLIIAPGSYATVFLVAFVIAVVGVGVLMLFVRNRGGAFGLGHVRHSLWRPVGALWSHRLFRRVLLAAALLSIPAVSDSFLFLTLRRHVDLKQQWFPMLFVIESVIYLLFAWPFGRLADHVGAGRVLLGGQIALACSFAFLLVSPPVVVALFAVPVCLGLFFAATDGVLASRERGSSGPRADDRARHRCGRGRVRHARLQPRGTGACGSARDRTER